MSCRATGHCLFASFSTSYSGPTVFTHRLVADGGVRREGRYGAPHSSGWFQIHGLDDDGTSWGLAHSQPAGLYTTITPPTTADTVLQFIDEQGLRRVPSVVVAHSDAGDQEAPTVAHAPGVWMVTWADGTGTGVTPMVRAISPQGEPLSAPTRLSSAALDSYGIPASITWDGNGFIAVWTETRERVMARFISRGGVPLGEPFLVFEDVPNHTWYGRPASVGGRTLLPYSRYTGHWTWEAVIVEP
jgi:hypothetical protein